MLGKTNGKHTVQVMLVDDHPIIRWGLRQLIDQEPGFEVTAEAEDAYQALSLLRIQPPNFMVVDLTLNGIGGLELIKQVHLVAPELPILVFSMHDEAIYAERTLRAGAKGYLMKQSSADKLIPAIRHILQGNVYLSESITAHMVGKISNNGRPQEYRSGFTLLSDRELEVFELIGRGLTTRMIAGRLCVSVKTIEAHREHIKRKLSIQHGAELTTHATQWVIYGGARREEVSAAGH